MATLPAFDKEQLQLAQIYLATQVAEMMGRKFEEGDWARVYAAAKNIPLGTWSNLNIDVSHGALGVEHKMICRPAHKSILDACGTSIMHPAGTRAIRIPAEEDPTIAAREVLRQYGELVDERTAIVRIRNEYNHQLIDRNVALSRLIAEARMTKASAAKTLPNELTPVGEADSEPDMRMGWVLWTSDLSEFLYFEEKMTKPNPADFVAELKSSGGGRRRASRNLWVYNRESGEKLYSITTEAGAKVQPYFKVPSPNDPNLCHFVAQGEQVDGGFIRVWLTPETARSLSNTLGSLESSIISKAIETAQVGEIRKQKEGEIFSHVAVEILVPVENYILLRSIFEGVSDEHNFKQLLDHLHD